MKLPAWVQDMVKEQIPDRFTGEVEIRLYCFEGGVAKVTMGPLVTWQAPNGWRQREAATT